MNMKRVLSLLLLAMTTVAVMGQPLQAQGLSDNQRLLGYTLTDDIDVNGAAFGEAGTYTVGAVLTPQMLAPYEGCRVVGLRMAAAMTLGRTRTFLYRSDGSSLTAAIEQKQRLYEGWNNVFFNGDGYLIQGNESLFFGFDYVETADMVSADQGGLCGVGVETDGAFYLYGDYGQGEGLYSISGVGCLCVQLIVDVSSLPAFDIDLMDLDAGFKYKQPGENIEALLTFINVGRMNVGHYQMGYQLDNEAPVCQEITDSLAEGRMGSWLFDCKLPDDIAIGMHQLKVFVAAVEDEPLTETSKNDTITVNFAIYRQSLQREKAYLEVYTDQTSPYSAFLNDALNQLASAMANQLTIVNVHRPGTALAVSDAAYLHQLYAYVWPSFTMNRSYFPGEEHVAYDMNDYLAVIGTDMTAAIIGDMVAQDYYSPAFAGLELTGSFDAATRQLTVTATGEVLPEAEAIYGDLALTLILAEDRVKSPQSVYNPKTQRITTNSNYLHNQVLRSYLTAPTGSSLTIDNNRFTATFTTTVDASWQADKLTVVGLLSKYADTVTEENLRDMDVVNATSLSLNEMEETQHIESTLVTPIQEHSYTVGGRHLNTNGRHHGLVIRDGKKFMMK